MMHRWRTRAGTWRRPQSRRAAHKVCRRTAPDGLLSLADAHASHSQYLTYRSHAKRARPPQRGVPQRSKPASASRGTIMGAGSMEVQYKAFAVVEVALSESGSILRFCWLLDIPPGRLVRLRLLHEVVNLSMADVGHYVETRGTSAYARIGFPALHGGSREFSYPTTRTRACATGELEARNSPPKKPLANATGGTRSASV